MRPLFGLAVALVGLALSVGCSGGSSPAGDGADGRPAARCTVLDLRKRVTTTSVELSWSTDVPVLSSVIWRSGDGPDAVRALPGGPTTTHSVRIDSLGPDRDYQVTLVSRTQGEELSRFGPVPVRLLGGLAADLGREFDRVGFESKVFALPAWLRGLAPERLRSPEALGSRLDPLRRPLGLLKPISREFFSCPEISLRDRVRAYQALKTIQRLECAASGKRLPLIPLLTGVDWGIFYQSPVSPRELPSDGWETDHRSSAVSDPRRPRHGTKIEEWLDDEVEREAFLASGVAQGVQQECLSYRVTQPARIRRAELRVVHRPAVSGSGPARPRFHSFEVNLNGRIDLVAALPELDPDPDRPTVDHLGFDPALLREGENLVRIRVVPCPGFTGQGGRCVISVDLRTQRVR